MKYQVGDKVRIVSVKSGECWNPEGKMDKWLGKIMTIKKVSGVFKTYGESYSMIEDREEHSFSGWCWYEHMVDCKILFKVKCTRSDDDRFTVGKEYYVDEHGQLTDNHGELGACNYTSSYEAWYKDCNWVDYAFELLEDYTKAEVEDIKEEVKMSKYNVGDLVKFNYYGELKGIGKIVETDSGESGHSYLIELPEELHGEGHKGNGFSHKEYDKDNYWFFQEDQIECVVWRAEEVKSVVESLFETEAKVETKPTETKVEDQFLYKCNTKADGSIAFNKVKMLNLCFVKYNPDGQVYTFINPTDKLLKEGTKVLVDSAGDDSVGYVVASVKVQKKCAKDLLYAMTSKKGLELKYVLGVYETKTVKTEVEELIEFGGAA